MDDIDQLSCDDCGRLVENGFIELACIPNDCTVRTEDGNIRLRMAPDDVIRISRILQPITGWHRDENTSALYALLACGHRRLIPWDSPDFMLSAQESYTDDTGRHYGKLPV